jgi:hypothetical protein
MERGFAEIDDKAADRASEEEKLRTRAVSKCAGETSIIGLQHRHIIQRRQRMEIKDPLDPDIVFVPLGEPKSLAEQLAELRAELAEVKEQLRVGLTKVDVWGEGVDDTLASIASGCLHGFANRAYCATCSTEDREKKALLDEVEKLKKAVAAAQFTNKLGVSKANAIISNLPRNIRNLVESDIDGSLDDL